MMLLLVLTGTTACEDLWDAHYNEGKLVSDGAVELYDGTVTEYLHSQSELSTLSGLFDKAGVTAKLSQDHMYTVVVYPDPIFKSSKYVDTLRYANYCVSDRAVSPSNLFDGLGLQTWLGKVIWFNAGNGNYLLDKCPIKKVIKAKNAFIYYIDDAVIPIRPSVYEILNGLGDEYSVFKGLVKQYEETYFDPSVNMPNGTNSSGSTVYKDSVWSVKNTLMDRYLSDGSALWNMRAEGYASTMNCVPL